MQKQNPAQNIINLLLKIHFVMIQPGWFKKRDKDLRLLQKISVTKLRVKLDKTPYIYLMSLCP